MNISINQNVKNSLRINKTKIKNQNDPILTQTTNPVLTNFQPKSFSPNFKSNIGVKIYLPETFKLIEVAVEEAFKVIDFGKLTEENMNKLKELKSSCIIKCGCSHLNYINEIPSHLANLITLKECFMSAHSNDMHSENTISGHYPVIDYMTKIVKNEYLSSSDGTYYLILAQKHFEDIPGNDESTGKTRPTAFEKVLYEMNVDDWKDADKKGLLENLNLSGMKTYEDAVIFINTVKSK